MVLQNSIALPTNYSCLNVMSNQIITMILLTTSTSTIYVEVINEMMVRVRCVVTMYAQILRVACDQQVSNKRVCVCVSSNRSLDDDDSIQALKIPGVVCVQCPTNIYNLFSYFVSKLLKSISLNIHLYGCWQIYM
jgi:hypothetical protein